MFTTVVLTRLIIFLVVALVVAAIVFAGSLSPTAPGRCSSHHRAHDPVARYCTAVMRLRLISGACRWSSASWPVWWPRATAGACSCTAAPAGVTDPQFGKDLGFYAFEPPFFRLVVTILFVAVFLAFLANVVAHYVFGGIRLDRAAGRAGAGPHPAGGAHRVLVLMKAKPPTGSRYELLPPHPERQAVHRCRLHRHQCRAAG